MIVPIGTMTKFGTIVAVGWVGERYYWCIDKHDVVSMMPAMCIEEEVKDDKDMGSA